LRHNGATAGVTRQGTQAVFSSSKSPAKTHTTKAAKTTAPANATATTAPTRSATADLWSGVKSATTSPITAAEASAGGQSTGMATSVIAGLAILGLGIAGLTGTFLITAGRRRTATKTKR